MKTKGAGLKSSCGAFVNMSKTWFSTGGKEKEEKETHGFQNC